MPSGGEAKPASPVLSSPAPAAPATAPSAWAISAALAVGTFALYARSATFGFIRFDDNRYLTENPVVQRGLSWDGVAWAFGALRAANWHPLTWLSHMLDVTLFGMNPGAHHLVNAFLHAVNAALVFAVLWRMTGSRWRSAMVAALFAVHPLHVESVAWVSERKDLLSTTFGLLALGAYRRYVERPGAARYAAVAVLLAASLLAKPMWVTFPFLLLLLDGWPLGRAPGAARGGVGPSPGSPPRSWPVLVLEKVPFLFLAAASSAATVYAQHRGGAIAGLELPPGSRVANAVVAYVQYLASAFWPASLSIYYPHPGQLPIWEIGGAAVLLVLVTVTALGAARSLPWLAVGWCWFLGMLVPVIGIVQVGGQARADRYTYVPLVGLFIAVVWGGHRLLVPRLGRAVTRGIAVAILAILAVATTRQLGHWASNETVFTQALAVNPDDALAHGVLAEGLRAERRFEEALLHARAATRLEPGNAQHWETLGLTARDAGALPEAREALETALRLGPGRPSSWLAMGWVLEDLNDLPDAEGAYQRTVELAPRDPDPWFRLGVVRTQLGAIEGAIACYRAVVELAPRNFAAWTNIAVLYQGAGRPADAGEAFLAATRANPGNPMGWRNLGVYHVKAGQLERAADAFRRALQVGPPDPDVLRRLGLVDGAIGARAEALQIAARLEAVDPAAAAEIRARAALP
jgi:tetratricopeptide (TPR) repeat protein